MGILAHGPGGGGSDLPLPAWMFAYGAAFAVLIGSVALGTLWPRPRLAGAAGGRPLPPAVQAASRPLTLVLRALGLGLYAVVLWSLLAGADEGRSNFGALVVSVAFWVGVPVLATVAGDVFLALNPLDTLAAGLLRAWPGAAERRRPGAGTGPGLWPAAVMVLSFTWLVLAHHGGASPRSIGIWLVAYSLAALAGAVRWGRGWSLAGEGFAALFGLVGAIGVVHRDDRGRLRLRRPVAGLAAVAPVRGLAALLLVALGSAAFDGVTGLDWWTGSVMAGRSGWEATAVATAGLLATIAAVAGVWLAATRLAARAAGDDPAVGVAVAADARAAALVPVVVAYSLAHSFSYAFYGMFDVVALASDPLGRGRDLFGTIDVAPDYRLLSATVVGWVQVGSIVAGHLAGLLVAHDRALERHRRVRVAIRSQRPLAAAMAAYAAGGLLLFLAA